MLVNVRLPKPFTHLQKAIRNHMILLDGISAQIEVSREKPTALPIVKFMAKSMAVNQLVCVAEQHGGTIVLLEAIYWKNAIIRHLEQFEYTHDESGAKAILGSLEVVDATFIG